MPNVSRSSDGSQVRQEIKVIVVGFTAIVTSLGLMWSAPRIASLVRPTPDATVRATDVALLETGSTSAIAAPFAMPKSTVAATPMTLSSVGGMNFAIGDSLKLTVFEKLVADRSVIASVSGAEPTVSPQINYIERVDLSGTYVIQLDGTLYLPLLGDVVAIGRARGELQQDIVTRYSSEVGRPVAVSIAVSEREPIYVLGSVARPGTYKYSAHLSVDHLIALAGGYEGANQEASRLTDGLREAERHARSVEALKHLLARQAVLLSERRDTERAQELQNSSKVSQSSAATARLSEIIPAGEAAALIDDVRKVRALLRQSRQNEITTLEAVSVATAREVSLIKDRMALIQGAIKNRSERATRVASLERSGAQTSHMSMTAHNELSDARERQIEAMSVIVAAEMRIFQTQQKKQALEIQSDIERERELEGLQKEIATEEAVIAASRTMMKAHFGSARMPENSGRRLFNFEVTRRTTSGLVKVVASETFELHPGDLLKINRSPLMADGN
jgi:polysaccharide biosynthesis/export protein ExoF